MLRQRGGQRRQMQRSLGVGRCRGGGWGRRRAQVLEKRDKRPGHSRVATTRASNGPPVRPVGVSIRSSQSHVHHTLIVIMHFIVAAISYTLQVAPLDILDLDCTTQQTSTASGNETHFLTGNSGARNRRRLSDMLMITTTVRMVNGIHSNTTSTGPAVTIISTFIPAQAIKSTHL